MSGPDVFISYARSDADKARRFADAIGEAGFDVWWDDALRSGEVFDEAIENALAAARAVVVLWSPASVSSRWVRAEATEAERNGTLVPVTIEPCKRPIIFELMHTADLSHWDGDTADAGWRAFVGELRRQAGSRGENAAAPAAAPARAGTMPAAGRSVVVLPFANMSRDEDQEYFADGITEDIITDLSKVSALMVIARNTAFTFKGKAVDVCHVARQLGVTHVLEGSVRKAGNRVRVNAQLIDGATGGHVWAERYDRDLADIFAIQDELSEAIVGALRVRLLPDEKKAIEVRDTRSAEAYDFYLRARALRAAMQPGDMPRAVEAYRRALQFDPGFARAWAGLATMLLNLRTQFSKSGDYSAEEMETAFARAHALAPDSPDVVAAMLQKSQYERDWEAAEECLEFFRLREDTNWSAPAILLHVLGRTTEAIEQQYRVVKEDPLSGGASYVLQSLLNDIGRFEEAEAEYQKSRDLPTARQAIEFAAVKRAMAMGDREKTKSLYAAQFGRNNESQAFAAGLIANFDQPEKALGVLREAFEGPQGRVPIIADSVVHWALFFGERELAWAAFCEAYVEKGSHFLMGIWQPMFRDLRQLPEFKQVLIEVGLADHWRKTGRWGDYVRPLGDDDFEVIR